MNHNLDQLIDQARNGESEPFNELVAALRADGGIPASVLAGYARSSEEFLRRAAVAAAKGRTEPELLHAIEDLVHDSAGVVRYCLAYALEETPLWPLDGAVEKLLYDEDGDVRLAAARAARWRPALEATLLARLNQDDGWRIRQAIAAVLAHFTPRAVLPALVAALGNDSDSDVQKACAASIEKHLATLQGYPTDLGRPPHAVLEEAQRRVTGFSGYFPALSAWLADRIAHDVDLDQLRAFGTVLTTETEATRLPRAYGVQKGCDALRAVLNGDAPRAAVLLGESGAGKSAVVYELVQQLRNDPAGPWHVLRIAPSELLAGTHWLGEWQTKVRNLVNTVRYPRRVALFIPNLEELSDVGRSSSSDANVATALAPHIERGEVAIIGESTPEAFRTGLGSIRTLRRLFHAIEVRETGPQETRTILQAVRDESGADVPEPMLDRLVELADYYLTGTAQPGRAVGLLRRVLSATAHQSGPITDRDVLSTLSTSTGIPVDFLDDRVPLDRARVRAFFEARVMGQPEAVDAVVDLVTLVKAGLTDPGKPFGVLLFVGPTGVGKTELARSLAEMLFGDAGRLLRLDMSEFATYEAFERLIGYGAKPGLLTAAVRERPFAVLLLDEIEKAHFNVFDLCLQIFDAGRLTDAQGRTADFRRTIIILTSNIGATMSGHVPVGFRAGGAPPAPAADPDREVMLRELGRFFRPEFLNRLDRVVNFRPLSEETAEKIARREVARVLERSGIARRRLAVDVEPAVLPLLLREGYSPAFGARPLKRTVERLVLLPVARAIAAGGVPPGSLLRLVARSNRVDVEVAPPEPDSGERAPAGPAVPPVPGRSPLASRVASLVERVEALSEQAAPLAALKSELVARSAAADFWNNAEAARGVLDDIYRLDGIFTALDAVHKGVREQHEAVQRHRLTTRDLARIEERLSLLDSQARHVAFLVGCRDARDLGDAFLTLTLVKSHGAGLNAIGSLGRMYLGLAHRHRFQVEVLDDRQGGDPHEDVITLSLSGAGAFALLAGEAGLHQLSRGRSKGRDGRQRPVDRDVVRIEVFPVPLSDAALAGDEVRVETRPLAEVAGRLLPKPRLEVQLLHVPSMTSLRAWAEGAKSQAIGRLRPLLHARVLASRLAPRESAGRPTVVRRYTIGPAPLVRDLRTGLSTGRLDQVLSGQLDRFLILPGENPPLS